MTEKLLLAAALTFTLSIFAETNLSFSWSTPKDRNKQNQTVITLTPHKN